MTERCDNLSVGVIVTHSEDILLLGRAKFPYGLAAPAGHVDSHGSLEQTAVAEVYEETGIKIVTSSLKKLIAAKRTDNTCRRLGGDHHTWTVYAAEAERRELTPSTDETLGARWFSPTQLHALIERSTAHSDTIKCGDQILEPIWLNFLQNYLQA